MKRILALALVGALALSTLATGVVGAHPGWGGAKSDDRGDDRGGDRGGGLGTWTGCVLTPAVTGTTVLAKATPGKPGGAVHVLVIVKRPAATATAFAATVTPTFPTAGAGPLLTLARNGTSFVLKEAVPVPATATAGNATLAIAGTYGASTFTCPGLAAKIKLPRQAPAPVCTSVPAGLGVRAWATPAMPGGTLWVAIQVKKRDPAATLTATATATIPPAAATPALALKALGGWPVLAGSFPVATTATLGASASVAISGTYTLANVATTFTCSLRTPIKNVRFWAGRKGDD